MRCSLCTHECEILRSLSLFYLKLQARQDFHEKKLSGITERATKITGSTQIQLSYLNSQAVRRKAESITNPSHPIHHSFQLLPSGCCFRARRRTSQNSFIPSEISILNKAGQTFYSAHLLLLISGLICLLIQFYVSLLWQHVFMLFVSPKPTAIFYNYIQ